jgi:hypothetical protein
MRDEEMTKYCPIITVGGKPHRIKELCEECPLFPEKLPTCKEPLITYEEAKRKADLVIAGKPFLWGDERG